MKGVSIKGHEKIPILKIQKSEQLRSSSWSLYLPAGMDCTAAKTANKASAITRFFILVVGNVSRKLQCKKKEKSVFRIKIKERQRTKLSRFWKKKWNKSQSKAGISGFPVKVNCAPTNETFRAKAFIFDLTKDSLSKRRL